MNNKALEALVEKLQHPHDGTMNGINMMQEGIRRGYKAALQSDSVEEMLEQMSFEWKKKTDRYSNGETLFVNGVPMGEYFWAKITSEDKSYKVTAKTPGLKLKETGYDDIESAKQAVENLIKHWFRKMLSPSAAIKEATTKMEKA